MNPHWLAATTFVGCVLAVVEGVNLLQVTVPIDANPRTHGSVATQQLFYVMNAAFGPRLPSVSSIEPERFGHHLVRANLSSDCSRIMSLAERDVYTSLEFKDAAVLVPRGEPCSFARKVYAAQQQGASLVIVEDTIEGAVTNSHATGQPIYNCELGAAIVKENATTGYPEVGLIDNIDACTRSSTCSTNTCVYTGLTERHPKGFQVCCFQNTLIRMGIDSNNSDLAQKITIPAIFLSFQDAKALESMLKGSTNLTVMAFDVKENPWNLSMLLIWILGVVVVVGGAYYSASQERQYSYQKVASLFSQQDMYVSIEDLNEEEAHSHRIDDKQHRKRHGSISERLSTWRHQRSQRQLSIDYSGDQREETKVNLTAKHVTHFIVGSSSVLILLYFGHMATILNVLLMVLAIMSMAHVFVSPLLLTLIPSHTLPGPASERHHWVQIMSIVIAATVSLYWFIQRSSPHIWPLQDFLCITLCFFVLASAQISSIRVATLLLSTAFCYDVFFVYFSPYLFGSSVMIDVVTGGGKVRDFCHVHPEATECNYEKVYAVLTIPLVFSHYGGSVVLGLGDLFLPGLFVSFAIRYDYCMGYALSSHYFCLASVLYAIGLFLTVVMDVVLRDVITGQPALMYIVPLMLGGVFIKAWARSEWKSMWEGPICLLMETLQSPDRREETEPFFKTH